MSDAQQTEPLGDLPEWNLSDLYPGPDSPELLADLERVAADAEAFKATYQGKLVGADAETILTAIETYEATSEVMGRIGAFGFLNYVGDQQNPDRVKFFGDIQGKLTDISSHYIFFTLELNEIADDDLAAALKHDGLSRYKPYFDELRKGKPFQLDEELERVFHDKSQTSRSAFNRLFDETMSGLRFDVAGEPEPMPLEPTLNLLTDKDRKRREAASDAVAATLKDNVRLFTLITNTLAKDKEISDRWRGFKDVADARHLSNRVEAPVVDALVTAVRESYPKLSHRYYAMKARWLGMDKLAHWDRNAPLPEKPERVIPWAEAQSIVLGAYRGFAPMMAELAQPFFDDRWIDAPTRPGKGSGAFAHPTVPSVHPYVMMNYQGKSRDVMTLAHELGHGVHQRLAAKQGLILSSTPLTLAETASVFGEMLTFKALLKGAADPKERKALLAGKVEDMINTVVRQIAFYEFERKIHLARRDGELTSEQIGEAWMSVQGESLGPAIELKPGYELFWAYVPHFIHSPFYVYAYAFGDCLVNSLYALYEDAHPGFVDKYFEMLSAGGTKHHSELLAPFGLDASKPEFWHKGLAVIEGLIDELEAMER
ncbi:MAG: M3 family oligoendopeptidase [Pseudomonadota bacterium]